MPTMYQRILLWLSRLPATAEEAHILHTVEKIEDKIDQISNRAEEATKRIGPLKDALAKMQLEESWKRRSR